LILVSCADKLHNARAIWTDIQRDGVETMKRFNAPGEEIAWYYASLLACIRITRGTRRFVNPVAGSGAQPFDGIGLVVTVMRVLNPAGGLSAVAGQSLVDSTTTSM